MYVQQMYLYFLAKSAGVHIPLQILEALSLTVDSQVDVLEENGVIAIQPAARLYGVETLIVGITPGNGHGEVSFGVPVGKESL